MTLRIETALTAVDVSQVVIFRGNGKFFLSTDYDQYKEVEQEGYQPFPVRLPTPAIMPDEDPGDEPVRTISTLGEYIKFFHKKEVMIPNPDPASIFSISSER